MVGADVGTLTKKYISFTKSIQARNSALCHDAIIFEIENSESPNFWSFNQGYNLDLREVHTICDGNYGFGVIKY